MIYNIESLEELLKQNGEAGSDTKTYRFSRLWFFEKTYTYTQRDVSKFNIEYLVGPRHLVDPKREYFWKLLRKTAATEYVTEGGYPTVKFREEVLEHVIKIIHDPSSKEHKDNLINLGKKLPFYSSYQDPLRVFGILLLTLMLVILPITLIPSAGGVVFPFAIGITISIISLVAGLLLLAASYLADRSDCSRYQYQLQNTQTINFGLFQPKTTSSQIEMETHEMPEESNSSSTEIRPWLFVCRSI